MSSLESQTLPAYNPEMKDFVPDLKKDYVIDGNLQIIKNIATGGQARIYEAHDIARDLDVAVKVPFIPSKDIYWRVIREIAVAEAASEQTDNVPKFYGAGMAEIDNHPFFYYEMEEMSSDLEDRLEIEPTGRLSVDKCRKVLGPVFDTIDKLFHKNGLLHKDIKDGNVLLDSDDNGKITDFGIVGPEGSRDVSFSAENIAIDAIVNKITGASEYLGTPMVLAPEIVLLEATHSKASDVYSAGNLLRKTLTGRGNIYVEGLTLTGIYRIMETYESPTVDDIFTDQVYPQEIEDITAACLERQPEMRPRMDEVAAALQTV